MPIDRVKVQSYGRDFAPGVTRLFIVNPDDRDNITVGRTDDNVWALSSGGIARSPRVTPGVNSCFSPNIFTTLNPRITTRFWSGETFRENIKGTASFSRDLPDRDPGNQAPRIRDSCSTSECDGEPSDKVKRHCHKEWPRRTKHSRLRGLKGRVRHRSRGNHHGECNSVNPSGQSSLVSSADVCRSTPDEQNGAEPRGSEWKTGDLDLLKSSVIAEWLYSFCLQSLIVSEKHQCENF